MSYVPGLQSNPEGGEGKSRGWLCGNRQSSQSTRVQGQQTGGLSHGPWAPLHSCSAQPSWLAASRGQEKASGIVHGEWRKAGKAESSLQGKRIPTKLRRPWWVSRSCQWAAPSFPGKITGHGCLARYLPVSWICDIRKNSREIRGQPGDLSVLVYFYLLLICTSKESGK